MDWGNVPTWIGMLVGAGSLAVAARTYVVNTRRQLRAQANKVALSLTRKTPRSTQDYVHEALVENHSDAPIWNVQISISRYRTVESGDPIKVLPPGGKARFGTEPYVWALYGGLGPDDPRPMHYGDHEIDTRPYPAPTASVRFLDADGYRWKRSGTDSIAPDRTRKPPKNGRWYRIRKRIIPAKLRHAIRDRWRGWVATRPQRQTTKN